MFRSSRLGCLLSVTGLLALIPAPSLAADQLEPIRYNNPGLVVDLGVGLWAWPLPMDYDGDGDLDLVVSCPDKPSGGVYLFENKGAVDAAGARQEPIFKPAKRLGPAVGNIQISYVDGDVRLLAPGVEYLNFRDKTWDEKVVLPVHPKLNTPFQRTRANQWKSVDYDGDGDQDLIVGLGVWDDYGWDDAWDENGAWKNGPLHGYVYLVENVAAGRTSKSIRKDDVNGRTDLEVRPTESYADPVQLTTTDGKPVDVYGMPSPNVADFDGDGDLDLLCGEFMDGFTYFENTGTRAKPTFPAGQRIKDADGNDVRMDLQMITPVAIDWDGDGDTDLICGDEDGRVAFIEYVGRIVNPSEGDAATGTEGAPIFKQPVYFQQEADFVKFGALVTPCSVDWDEDGDEDLICGNTAGYVGWIENLDGGNPPKWGRPRYLPARGFTSFYQSSPDDWRVFPGSRQQAGPKGSIQGPCEAKWGYTTLSVADWYDDGTLTIIANGIWGSARAWPIQRERFGERQSDVASPQFDTNGRSDGSRAVTVQWDGNVQKPEWTWWTPSPRELVTQWRTTPCVVDWNEDRRPDLVMLDHEGYLAFYERIRWGDGMSLLPPKRLFKIEGPCEFDSRHRPVGDKQDGLLRLNANRAGASGRRKLCFTDWDGDGRLDLLVNSENVNWLRNVRTDDEGFTWFEDMGQLDDRVLAGHTTSPTVVDWDKNGIPDLLVGAEDGRLYYKENPRARLAAGLAPRASEETAPAADQRGASPAASDAAKPQAAAIVSNEFIYEDAPFPSCHASTIDETPAGLVAAWFGGTAEGDKDVGIWVSRKVDGTWTPPVEVANGVQHEDLRYPTWNPVLFQSPGKGPLLLFYKCGPSPSEWWGMLTTSRDSGQTWSVPFRLPEGIDGPVKNKPVVLPNNTLLSGSSTEYDGWRVHFELTRDSLHWTRIGPINDASTFNAIQPTILTHPDGTLQALCRTKEQVIVSTKSTDMGRTWSPLEATSLPNPNSGIDGVTLADGRHLLVYNHTTRTSQPRGREMLNVALSENGDDWQAALTLQLEPGAEFSYPAVIQTDDGLVHMTYTWKRKRIKHVVLDPTKLELTPIVDGKWPSEQP